MHTRYKVSNMVLLFSIICYSIFLKPMCFYIIIMFCIILCFKSIIHCINEIKETICYIISALLKFSRIKWNPFCYFFSCSFICICNLLTIY
nr:MAG TPA: hypothetical protein [Caudoviricetes sp.]